MDAIILTDIHTLQVGSKPNGMKGHFFIIQSCILHHPTNSLISTQCHKFVDSLI